MKPNEIKKVMRKAYNRWYLNGYTNGLNYLLKIKENFDTAAWTTQQKDGKKVNVIYIGDNALEMCQDNSSQEMFLMNLLHHEFGHSKFTDQRFELINRECEKIYTTFQMFNLFEDCRMEQKVRNLTEHRFGWFNYIKPEYMGVGHHHPESLLLAFKNAEALVNEEHAETTKVKFVKAYCCAEFQNPESLKTQDEAQEAAEGIVDRVLNYYYPLTTEAPTSLSLIPVIKEWMEEFYDTDELKRQQEAMERLKEIADAIREMMKQDGMSGGSMPGSGLDGDEEESGEKGKGDKTSGKTGVKEFDDLSDTKELSESGEAADGMDNGTEEVAGNSMTPEPAKEGQHGKGKKREDDNLVQETEHLEEFSNAPMLKWGSRYAEEYDRKEVAKLLPIFEKFLKNKSQNVSTTRPSKRMSTRNVMLDREKIYKRKDEIVKGEKKISIVVDCSGSMGRVMRDMRVVIAIINELAFKGKVSGNIILSGSEGYESLKMPMNRDDIESISGFSGSEGLALTFKENISLLKQSDYVFCLTDGDIYDEPVDKKFLAKHNVRPIGIYIGEEAKNLKEWFDRYVNRTNAKYTVDEMARKIK